MGLPGRSLELRGDAHPRGMTAHDRTRLTGRLFFSADAPFRRGRKAPPNAMHSLRERENQEKNQEKYQQTSRCQANACQALAYAGVKGAAMRKISAGSRFFAENGHILQLNSISAKSVKRVIRGAVRRCAPVGPPKCDLSHCRHGFFLT